MKIYILMCAILSALIARTHIYSEPFLLQKPLLSWQEMRDKHLSRQKYDYSCGSASLSTILTYYYGAEFSEKDILDALLIKKGIDVNDKERLETDKHLREGVNFSFADLAEFANENGFIAQGLALDLEALSKLKIPVIIYVNVRDMEHFTVYKGRDRYYVYLADPSFGNIKVSLNKFQEMFYKRKDLTHPGKILAILPKESIAKNEDFMQMPKDNDFVLETIKNRIIK